MVDRRKIRFVRRLTEASMADCVRALEQTGGDAVEAAKLLRTPEQTVRDRAWLSTRSIVPDVDGGAPTKKEQALYDALEEPLKPLRRLDPVPGGYPPAWLTALQQAAQHERDDAFLVFADWLQEHGDPRGELIALQHDRGDRGPSASELQLIRAFHAELVGAIENERWLTDIRWRMGFVRHLHTAMHPRGETWTELWVAELSRFLAHPSCSLLCSLSIGWVSSETDYDRLLGAVCERAPTTLARLAIGDARNPANLCCLNGLDALSGLQELIVRGYGFDRLLTRQPALGEHLTALTLDLPDAGLARVLSFDWSMLRSLRLELDFFRDLDPRQLAERLATAMPGLQRFELHGYGGLGHLDSRWLNRLSAALERTFVDLEVSF